MTDASRLDAASRSAALRALADEPLDVPVVGGGITGIGTALDAAMRGLRVGIVERDDFASGTSSKSTKLIHGGLRYLEQRDFALVREALHERELLLTRIAPHLVQPVPFLLPLHNQRERAYFGAGVALYDLMGGRGRAMPRHRHLGRRETLQRAPGIRPGIVGAIRYFDAQVDDARFALTLLRTAVTHDVHAASRTSVVGFLNGRRIEGVRLRDNESGTEFEARAKVTVIAGGVWSGQLERLAGVATPIAIRASKGVHILVPRDRLELEDALILRTERSVLLVVPWGEHWLIGTTDTPWTSTLDRPTASPEDVTYLLDRLNSALTRTLEPSDVTGVFAGLRPLVAARHTDTTRISREHVVRRPRPGIVTVTGGKYTTYRIMARSAIDVATAELGTSGARGDDPSPLLGTEQLEAARRELRKHPLDALTRERLIGRYGALSVEVADTASRDGYAVLPNAGPYLRAEATYGVTHEGALHLEDVLARRTRIAIEAEDGGAAAVPVVAAMMQQELGWSPQRAEDEIEKYRLWLSQERPAQAVADVAPAEHGW